MVSVDTNILVRIATQDDDKQARAADAFIAKGAWVSHLVLAETIWVLNSVYRSSRSELIRAIEMLLSQEHLVIESPEVVSTALEHFRTKFKLGFSDCLILEIARKAGHLPLGTFDRSLAKLNGTQKL